MGTEKWESSRKWHALFRKAVPFIFWPAWTFLMLRLPRILLVKAFYHAMAKGGAMGDLAKCLAETGMAGTCITFLCCILGLGAGILHAIIIEEWKPGEIWGPVVQPLFRALCMAVLGILCIEVLTKVFYLLWPSVREGYARDMARSFGKGSWSSIFLVVHVVLGPVTEETVFRGVVYRALRKENGIMLSACCNALLFGLYHDIPLQMAYTAAMGLILCLVTEKYRSLTCPVLLHMSFNLWGTEVIPRQNVVYFLLLCLLVSAADTFRRRK